jgi:hypothetical protein
MEREQPSSPPVFFVHVMKTAGTTFAFQIRRVLLEDQIYPNRFDRRHDDDNEPYTNSALLPRVSEARRERVRLYMGHFPFVASELIGIDCIPITVLREPFARTVSVLHHFSRIPRHRGKSPEQLYEDGDIRLWIDNHQTKIFSVTADEEPRALARTIPIDANRLRAAKANLANVAVIGLTERYGSFIEELRRRFNWWPDGIDHRARANVSNERPTISPELRRRILADNVFDLELYEHATHLLAERSRQVS